MPVQSDPNNADEHAKLLMKEFDAMDLRPQQNQGQCSRSPEIIV